MALGYPPIPCNEIQPPQEWRAVSFVMEGYKVGKANIIPASKTKDKTTTLRGSGRYIVLRDCRDAGRIILNDTMLEPGTLIG
jgi:hypothetical protein